MERGESNPGLERRSEGTYKTRRGHMVVSYGGEKRTEVEIPESYGTMFKAGEKKATRYPFIQGSGRRLRNYGRFPFYPRYLKILLFKNIIPKIQCFKIYLSNYHFMLTWNLFSKLIDSFYPRFFNPQACSAPAMPC